MKTTHTLKTESGAALLIVLIVLVLVTLWSP
jgi:Tfp pilus assembly protein PilX